MQVKLFQGQTHSRLKPTNVLLFFTILLLFHLSQYYNCQSRWIPSSKAAEGHIYLDAGKSKGKGALKELVTFSFGQRH